MFAKLFLSLTACLTLLACSDSSKPPAANQGGTSGSNTGGAGPPSAVGSLGSLAGSAGNSETGGRGGGATTGGDAAADALIVPAGVTVSPTPGGNGVFNVTALTLRQGASGAELYAAVKNVGNDKGCSPAFSIEVFDKTDQTLAVGVSGLLVQSFFRISDGSETIAACVAPGEVSMVAIKGLPADLVLEDVGRIDYRLNYWNLDAVPIAGVGITGVRAVTGAAGVTYTGTFSNGFDVPMSTPSVAVFAINRVGRPLGVAVANSAAELAPGESWEFETNTVTEAGTDQVAFPAGGP
jgi:hypothetical protein